MALFFNCSIASFLTTWKSEKPDQLIEENISLIQTCQSDKILLSPFEEVENAFGIAFQFYLKFADMLGFLFLAAAICFL